MFPELGEPGVPWVVVHGEPPEVLVESHHWMRVGLNRDGAFDLVLVAVEDQGSGAPAVAADPGECAGTVVAADRSHDACYFLV